LSQKKKKIDETTEQMKRESKEAREKKHAAYIFERKKLVSELESFEAQAAYERKLIKEKYDRKDAKAELDKKNAKIECEKETKKLEKEKELGKNVQGTRMRTEDERICTQTERK